MLSRFDYSGCSRSSRTLRAKNRRCSAGIRKDAGYYQGNLFFTYILPAVPSKKQYYPCCFKHFTSILSATSAAGMNTFNFRFLHKSYRSPDYGTDCLFPLCKPVRLLSCLYCSFHMDSIFPHKHFAWMTPSFLLPE